ncbi:AMP-binding protein [Peribacillus butanolivorans]|nr:AMP-binding protein [Peribacillus butanolivorans]
MLPNCLEYIIAYYAIHRLGGVVVQVNPLYQPNELDYILRDSEATWFIGHDKQKKKLEQIGLTDEFTIISANNMLENSLYSWSVAGNKDLPEMDINPKEDLALNPQQNDLMHSSIPNKLIPSHHL